MSSLKSNAAYLAEENHQLRNIIKNLPGDIYWKNKEGVWLGMNKRCINNLQRMGFIENNLEETILGKTDFNIFDEKTAVIYRENDIEVMQNKIEITREENTQLPSGEKIVLLSTKSPLFNKDNEVIGVIGNTIDITDRKKMEAELKNAKEAAEAGNKAKSDFIANMSHDIKTPLSGLFGLSKIIEDNVNDTELKELAHLMHEGSQQLLNLSNGILDMVSAEHLNEHDLTLESFDLRECIEDIAKLERPATALKKLALNVHVDKAIPHYVVSDRTKLHRILLNLVGNAIKFTQQGVVMIKALHLPSTQEENTCVQFHVTDTGIGIPLNERDKLFDRFYRATASYKGTYDGHGIGLHIANAYVNLLGGQITVNDNLMSGTIFSFDLSFPIGKKPTCATTPPALSIPISHTKTSTKTSPLTHPPSLPDNAPHVLLVEDNVMAMTMAKVLLTRAGCRLTTATTAEEAFSLVQTTCVDLIITDIGLPNASGIDLTWQIRQWEALDHKKTIPILGLSAHTQQTSADEARLCGMNAVFIKPITQAMVPVLLKHLPHSIASVTPVTTTILKAHAINNSLGFELPEHEAALFDLESYPLFDRDGLIENLGGEASIPMIIELMVKQEIPDALSGIKAAHDANNWDQMEKLVHRTKGGAASSGAVRLKMACQYLERYQKTGHEVLRERLYHQLMQVLQDTARQYTHALTNTL